MELRPVCCLLPSHAQALGMETPSVAAGEGIAWAWTVDKAPPGNPGAVPGPRVAGRGRKLPGFPAPFRDRMAAPICAAASAARPSRSVLAV